MINILNLRSGKPKHPWEFKVDRSSPLGNPYNMLHESERDIVCDKYRKWFYTYTHDDSFFAYLKLMVNSYKKYKKLNLFCWCHPERCHAETIKEYLKTIKEYLENDKISIRENNG